MNISRPVGFNKPQVEKFFDAYKSVLTSNHYGPTQIWNMDERGVSNVQKPANVIVTKGIREPQNLAAVEYTRSNGIELITLPPHCIHKPSHKAFFKPLKSAYKASADTWMIVNQATLIDESEPQQEDAVQQPQRALSLRQQKSVIHLTLLALRDNGLSHRGIDHMTISLRLLRGGQRNLQYLDISDNQDLDACCLEYLKVFSELKYLDISNTAISNKDSALRKFPLKIFLSSTKVDYEDIKEDMFRIETLGWASHVFNSWSKWYKNKTKRSKHRQYAPYISDPLVSSAFVASKPLGPVLPTILSPSTPKHLEF
ncbi:Hypothetical predicted protein [Octopus vulgaris]|uniref:Uncharacterized protein n=1 Tax=Octopus vulgaris TaxID=6645 RepID=A0AA36F3D3_OCTVU|nr:Hypothetical predicted protein [Octopus vulgaris]